MSSSQPSPLPHSASELRAAERALREAQTLLSSQQYEGAISRGYYAIYHAARAALYAHGSAPTTHRGVQVEFARLLVKSRKIEAHYGDMLRQARDERQVADYETGEQELIPDQDTARGVVTSAEQFIERVKKLVTEKQLKRGAANSRSTP